MRTPDLWILVGFVQLCAARVRAQANQFLYNTVYPVCSLQGGQNAVYWWISEDKKAGETIDTLPIQGVSGPSANQEVNLTLIGGAEWLRLDVATKELILLQSVDREGDKTMLDAVVHCKSLLPGDNFEVRIPVQITIRDVNDNTPVFAQSEYFVNITEELPLGTAVFRGLAATDADQQGPNSEVQYYIREGEQHSHLVTIPNPWEGTVVIGQRIDYESVKNFTVTIVAKDNGSPVLESTAQLHVMVFDADDLNPVFEYAQYTARVSALDAVGTIMTVLPAPIRAYDQDTLKEPVVYLLTGVFAEKFAIDPSSGIIRLQDNVYAGETYLLTIRALQEHRPERDAQATLRILVQGPNPGHPQFYSRRYTVKVLENAPIETEILRLNAVDPDENSVVSYAFKNVEMADNPFHLDALSGWLSVAKALDFEQRNAYQFFVVGSDGGHVTEALVEVFVLNVNDNSPQFLTDFYRFAPQAAATALVGTVQAFDKDIADRVTYSLLSHSDIFSIDQSGVLRITNARLLRNITYDVVISARDDGEPSRESFVTAKVDFSNTTGLAELRSAEFKGPLSEQSAMIIIVALGVGAGLLLVIGAFLLVCACRKKSNNRDDYVRRRPLGNKLVISKPQELTLPRLSTVTDHLPSQSCTNHASRATVNSTLRSQYHIAKSSYPTNAYDATFPYSEDSPHGSQSPLEDPPATPGTYRHDRAMSIEYSMAPPLQPGSLAQRRESHLARTHALSFEGPGIAGTLLPASNSIDPASSVTPAHNANRPPLTVYF